MLRLMTLLALAFWLIQGPSPLQPGQTAAQPQIATFTEDGAWCWFADPRAVFYRGRRTGVYAGWVTRGGDIQVGFHDLENSRTEIEILKPELQVNDHANPALLIRSDGHVMVFYSAHNGATLNYRLTENPEDISAWHREMQIGVNTSGTRGYTYPNPVQLGSEGGRIYLFWRGGNWKPNFSWTDDGAVWSPARTLFDEAGDRPYLKVASDGDKAIHLALNDGHPRNEPHNSIYYVRYQEGAFYNAAGDRLGGIEDLPLRPESLDRVYDGRGSGARAWIWDIAADSTGRPTLVYSVFPSEEEHRYRYARWGGNRWLENEITGAGGWFPQTPSGETESEPHYSGGVVLDHSGPSVVYLSRPVGNIFEVERWVTRDLGQSWRSSPVTSGSRQHNVRPVAVRGLAGALLWMRGEYLHYTRYDTAILIRRPPAQPSPPPRRGSPARNP